MNISKASKMSKNKDGSCDVDDVDLEGQQQPPPPPRTSITTRTSTTAGEEQLMDAKQEYRSRTDNQQQVNNDSVESRLTSEKNRLINMLSGGERHKQSTTTKTIDTTKDEDPDRKGSGGSAGGTDNTHDVGLDKANTSTTQIQDNRQVSSTNPAAADPSRLWATQSDRPGAHHVDGRNNRAVGLNQNNNHNDYDNLSLIRDGDDGDDPTNTAAAPPHNSNNNDDYLVSAVLVENTTTRDFRRNNGGNDNNNNGEPASTTEVVEAVPATTSHQKRTLFLSIMLLAATIIVVILILRGGGNNDQPQFPSTGGNSENNNSGGIDKGGPVLPSVVLNPYGNIIEGVNVDDRFSISMAMSSTMIGNSSAAIAAFGQGSQLYLESQGSDKVRVYYMVVGEAIQSLGPGGDVVRVYASARPLAAPKWIQLGSDIAGDFYYDNFGRGVDIVATTSSGTTTSIYVACGAPEKRVDNQRRGLVRVYRLDMPNTSNANDDGGPFGDWQQIGQDLLGLDEFDELGTKVALSIAEEDGTQTLTLAVSASQAAQKGPGYLRTYRYDSTEDLWVSTGGDDVLRGNTDGDAMGSSLAMTSDGTIVAVGSPGHADNQGMVNVFKWIEDTKQWERLVSGRGLGDQDEVNDNDEGDEEPTTASFMGDAPGDSFGSSVSLHTVEIGDGNQTTTCLAIGARQSSSSSSTNGLGSRANSPGYARVYCRDSKDWGWVQLGDDLTSGDSNDDFGTSIDLSFSSLTTRDKGESSLKGLLVAIGAPRSGGSGSSSSGRVYLYEFNGISWEVRDNPIEGFEQGDQLGSSVVLSSDSKILGCGSPFGGGSGHVRMFQLLPADLTARIQFTHSSDNESYLQDPNTLEEIVLYYSALLAGLQKMALAEGIVPMHFMGGDAILDNHFYKASTEVLSYGQPGIGDILMLNEMNLLGLGISNTDLNGGLDEFATFISYANFPIITVNYDFSNAILQHVETPRFAFGTDAGDCEASYGKIVKSCFYDNGDYRVGVIAAAPTNLFDVVWGGKESLPGFDFVGGSDDAGTPFVSPNVQILEQVDLLKKQGVRVIILMEREGRYVSDDSAARSYYGIDLVITGNPSSEFAVGKSNANGPFSYVREDDKDLAGGAFVDYPIVQEDSEGQPVLILATWSQYAYIGHLIVDFDMAGNVIDWDQDRVGPIATTSAAVSLLADFTNTSNTLEPPTGVTEIFESLSNTPSIISGFTVVATTTTPLLNVFGRFRETNLSVLVAESYLWKATLLGRETGVLAEGETVDISLKSLGGVRSDILGPNIIRLSIQSTLAFNNKISILRVTLDQLLAALENGFSSNILYSGRWPTISGLKVVYDESKPAMPGLESVTVPSRVQYVSLVNQDEGNDDIGNSVDELVLVDNFKVVDESMMMNRTFSIATGDYLVGGGDGYQSFKVATKVLETDFGEQQALEDYIVEALDGVVDRADPPMNPPIVSASEAAAATTTTTTTTRDGGSTRH